MVHYPLFKGGGADHAEFWVGYQKGMVIAPAAVQSGQFFAQGCKVLFRVPAKIDGGGACTVSAKRLEKRKADIVVVNNLFKKKVRSFHLCHQPPDFHNFPFLVLRLRKGSQMPLRIA